MDSKNSHSGATVSISVPVRRPEAFNRKATADVLAVLADSPWAAYGIRELGRIIDTSHKNVSAAVEDLEGLDLVETAYEGPKRVVSVNTDRLNKPEDPVLSIPQPDFHVPVRELMAELTAAIDDICGIVIFGSVARGVADRKSDIDCFVLVEGNQATAQKIAHETVDDLRDQRYDGDRYSFQVLVESVDTAYQYGDRLHEIFAEGITLQDSPKLREIKDEVLTDGQ
ncbi:nucleotidyltransferase domain-containing protein [Natrarchaeobius oligotrophus]|uniref:Nucleotidyltransferase domain-containing protein n=1 Tax=Natrarchaeobius chitinivorans TaxID=1679083 RepID=A0A3N6PUK9_NATCH|nr:nucleotidyltransferase domain-containing protein [Natrarchaeobius chitinivorans]RQH03486.1 nucleotidyltransferase domain-containing protein [Natrarchaeobius chitinivorans]